MRKLSTLRSLKYEEMTKRERAKLMIEDYESYAEKVPEEHWLQVLDGVARAGPKHDQT